MKNKLRIIGGEWRSRVIEFPDLPGLRPTPARVRETVFNWLQFDIAGSRCLDLFAGSGALGFEAASRGAKQVVQVEQNAKVCSYLRDNLAKLSVDSISVIQAGVEQYLANEDYSSGFNIVFLDPPFEQGLIQEACKLLEQKNWLTDRAKIYVEAENQLKMTGIPENWKLLKSKTAGEVGYHLFEHLV